MKGPHREFDAGRPIASRADRNGRSSHNLLRAGNSESGASVLFHPGRSKGFRFDAADIGCCRSADCQHAKSLGVVAG
jgi:hypothetical protein